VHAGRKTSKLRRFNGLLLHGSFLVQLAFLVMTDNLAPYCLTYEYVDDTTLTEIVLRATSDSHMPQYYLQALTL